MPPYWKGTITGIRVIEWAKVLGAPPIKIASLQFLEKSEKPGDDSVRFIEVSLPEGDDGAAYKVGQTVEMPVRITAKDKKVYYRAESAPAQTSAPRAAKA
jgi:hypothetical protein